MKWILLFVIALLLFGCGGGSSGGSEGSSQNRSLGNDFKVTSPQYSGLTDIAEIPQSEAGSITYEMFYALDFLSSIAFLGEYNHFVLFADNRDNSISSENATCSTGSVSTEESEANRYVKVEYSGCSIDGLRVSGTLEAKVHGTSSFGSNLAAATFALDLSFVDVASGESFTVEGYINLAEGADKDAAQAKLNVVFTNGEGIQMYFDDFIVSVSSWGDDYGKVYRGDFYYSSLGKVYVDTLSRNDSNNYGFQMEISGTHTMSLDVLLQNKMTLIYDNNSLPLTAPLGTLPDGLYSEVNLPPTANVNMESQSTDRGVPHVISALDSTDPNFDVLSFQWQVVDKPNGAEVTISPQPVADFIADTPGTYAVQLTVADNKGATNAIIFEVFVQQATPNPELVLETPDVRVNQMLSARLDFLNDEHDGPINIELAYGPNSLTIDQAGQINWPVDVPDFGTDLDVRFGVYLSNRDKQVLVPFELKVESGADSSVIHYEGNVLERIRRMGHSDMTKVFAMEGEKQSLALLTGEDAPPNYSKNVFNIYLNQDNKIKGEWDEVVINTDSALELRYDINGDGHIDELRRRYRSEQRDWEILMVDGANGQSEVVLTVGTYGGPQNLRVVEYANGSKLALTVVTRSDDRYRQVYSLPDFELLFEPDYTEYTRGYCDFNGDNELDLVTDSGVYDMANQRLIVEFEGHYYYNANVITVGDTCFVAELDRPQQQVHFWQNNAVISKQIDFGFYPKVGNFDGEAGQEIITSTEVEGESKPQWQMHKFSSSGEISQVILKQDDNVVLGRGSGAGYLGSPDLDGDGQAEILSFITNSYGYYDFEQGLMALAVNDGKLELKFEGEQIAHYNYSQIVSFKDDNELVTYDVTQFVEYSESGSRVISSSSDEITPIDKLLVVEQNGQYFYYTRGASWGGIAKYDANDTLIWQSDTDIRSSNVDQIHVGLSMVYYSSSGKGVFINDETGETLVERDVAGDITFVPESNLFFDHGLNAIREVLSDGRIVNVTEGGPNTFWQGRFGIEPVEISFVQYDDDPQFEFVVKDSAFITRSIAVYDGLSGELQEFKPWHFGGFGAEVLDGYRPLATCPVGEGHCRNELMEDDTFIYVRDKVSGELIWKGPYLAEVINDAQIKVFDGQTKTAIVGDVGVYIFQ